jgi:hypothetical protein
MISGAGLLTAVECMEKRVPGPRIKIQKPGKEKSKMANPTGRETKKLNSYGCSIRLGFGSPVLS